jgi:hypothetical protein
MTLMYKSRLMPLKPGVSLAIMLAFIGCAEDRAESPTLADVPRVDLSGIYAPAPFVARPEVFQPEVFPFTEAGRRLFDAHDPLVDNPRLADDCAPETMPGILWSGAPMQITQQDDRVVIRFERGGIIRDVPIGVQGTEPDPQPSDLGQSVARWEGSVLVIETITPGAGRVINNEGYPLSSEATLTERYWREDGELDLQLEVRVDDPINYTETFTLGRVWVWAPDEQIREWECVSLGPRETDIDIEELARQLEAL